MSTQSLPGTRLGVELTRRRRARRSTWGSRWATARHWTPLALVALAGATFIWSRFMMLTAGFEADEIHTTAVYVDGGPSVIWDSARWIPNNHMLFSLLGWVTINLTGDHSEPVYRLWGVFPALAAAVLMTWWLSTRIDHWVAGVFAVLATVSGQYFQLGVQARGYGLTFFAGVLLLVTADRLLRPHRTRDLALFVIAALVGILTLDVFALGFIATVAILLSVPTLRRQLAIAMGVVGLISLLWYLPVLSAVIGWNNTEPKLPWYGAVTRPLVDQFGRDIHLLTSSISAAGGALIAAVLLVIGLIALRRRKEGVIGLLMIVPVFFTYLVLDVARIGMQSRFASFSLLPLIGLAAIGLVELSRWIALRIRLAPVLAVVCVLLVVALGAFVNRVALPAAATPISAAKDLGQIIQESGFKGQVVANAIPGPGASPFSYYARPEVVRELSPIALETLFCTNRQPFIYIEAIRAAGPGPGCLKARGSFRITVRQGRGGDVIMWMIPRIAPDASLPGRG